MPIVIQTRGEWTAEHGGPLIEISPTTFLARDGAMLSDWGGGPRLGEPPAVLLEQLKARKKYHEHFLQEIETRFNRAKRMVAHGEVGTMPWSVRLFGDPPAGDVKAALRRLVELAAEHVESLEAINSEIESQPETRLERQREKNLAESRQRQAEARKREMDEVDEIQFPIGRI